MDWISKPVALWDWDNPLPPPSTPVTVTAIAGDDLSGDPPSSVDGSSVVDAPPPPPPAAPQLGLGLGKRTYFEGEKKGEKKGGGGHVHSTRCQVEGCGADLSAAKDYHRKHRVCENHSKCPRVVVAGQERRFCQQCSRFHELAEFDQKKRSCRRRLSDHNARRRKPQPDSYSFGSTRLSSPFYDERRQISFMWNKAPFSIMRQIPNSPWPESNFKFSNSKQFQIKPDNPNPSLLNPFPSVQVLNQEQKLINTRGTSNMDGAPDNTNLRRALSLLSSSPMQNPQNAPVPLSSPMQNPQNPLAPLSSPMQHTQNTPITGSLLQFGPCPSSPPAVTVGATNPSYWFEDEAASFSVQHGSDGNNYIHSNNGGVHLQEFQLLKPASYFDASQIH